MNVSGEEKATVAFVGVWGMEKVSVVCFLAAESVSQLQSGYCQISCSCTRTSVSSHQLTSSDMHQEIGLVTLHPFPSNLDFQNLSYSS